MLNVDIKEKKDMTSAVFSLSNKLVRLIWATIYILIFRFSPVPLFSFRRVLLLMFGAKVDPSARIYPSASIWLPANLTMAANSTLGPKATVYNQGHITIEERVIISQGAHLCASTHDYRDPIHPLVLAPIRVESDVWVCADAFIGPGVTVSEGCVVGARAVVTKDTESWGIYAGNPAKMLKLRERLHPHAE